MTQIVDYPSLTQALSDWTHRSDLAAQGFTDYFIAAAQEAIENDIFDLNFGNGIKLQEASYGPFPIINGVAPVPQDWIAPKVFYVQDGNGDNFTLIFKSTGWLYDNYPSRVSDDLPAYIARDVWQSSFQTPVLFVASQGQTAFVLPSVPQTSSLMIVSLDGAMLYLNQDYTLSGSTLTLNTGAQATQTLAVQYLTMSSGTQIFTANQNQTAFQLSNTNSAVILASQDGVVLVSGSDYSVSGGYLNLVTPAQAGQTLTVYYAIGSVFVFGPYPDSSYLVQGTYYAHAPILSASATVTTNWMVQSTPMLILAACLVEAFKFLKDAAMLQQWAAIYKQRLQAVVDRDKAERWAASTLQVEIG